MKIHSLPALLMACLIGCNNKQDAPAESVGQPGIEPFEVVGYWRIIGTNEDWTFRVTEDGKTIIRYQSEGETPDTPTQLKGFSAYWHLGTIDGQNVMILDYPSEGDFNIIWSIAIEGDKMRIQPFERDSEYGRLKPAKSSIWTHERVEPFKQQTEHVRPDRPLAAP